MFKKTSDLSKLIKGISFSWMRFALTIIIGITQTPLLFKYLSKEELNFWYIFYSFGAFLQMADLGLVQTISRLIAYIDNSDASDTTENTIANLSHYSTKQIYITSLFSFSLILVLSGAFVFTIYTYTYTDTGNGFIFKASFFIYVIGIIFNLLSNVPAAMLIGYRDVGSDSLVRSIAQIIYFLILFSFLSLYQSIILVSCSFMIQNLCQLIFLHLTFYKRHKTVFETKGHYKELIKLDIAKQIYSQSFPLVINQLGAWLIAQGNIFIASVVVGADKISDYAINQQIFTYITAVALVINQSMGPFIAKQYIQNKLGSLQGLFNNTIIICLSLVSVLLIVQLSCGLNIMTVWVGATHYLGYPIAIVFGLTTFFEVQHSVAGSFVWNTGNWPFNKWTLSAGILTVTLGYIFGTYYGLLGIAVATLISRLLTLNWYVVYYGLKKLEVTVLSYLINTISPLLLSILIATVVSIYIKYQALAEGFNNIITIVLVLISASVSLSLLVSILFRKSLLMLYKVTILPKIKFK